MELDKQYSNWPVPTESLNLSYLQKLAFVPDTFKYIDNDNISEHNHIPRILHLIWVGPDSAPESLNEYIIKWHKLIPNWEIRLWTNNDINTTEFPPGIVDKINSATKGAQKADIMRYFIVEKYGGFYADADIIPHNSLEPLVTNLTDANMVICHDIPVTWGYMANSFFGAIPNHPVMRYVSELCYNAIINTDDVHLQTGPRLFGWAISEIPLSQEKLYVLPHTAFYYNDRATYKFGKHTYAKMW
jgi:mannosyltransferase OCH1-like enzyme